MLQLILILRRHNGHVGNAAQISVVKNAMMRITVITDKTGTVQAQCYVQLLHADIVHDGVISTLHKGRINRRHRLHSGSSHACSRSNRMLLSNTNIKEMVLMRLGKNVQAGAVRHCSRNTHDFIVGIGKLSQGFTKNLGVAYRCIRISNLFAGSNIKGAGTVELIGAFFGRLVALALFRQHVYHNRSVNLFGSLQYIQQAIQIMSVNRSQISKAQLFKNRSRHHQVFYAALQAADSLQHITAEFHIFEPALNIIFNFIIGFACTQLIKIFTHRTHVFGNRHFVIVEHDNHILMQHTGVVQRLKSHTAGHGAVADNSYDIIILTLQIAGAGHAQSSGNRCTGMTGTEGIMLAFAALREAGKAAVLTQRRKLLPASGNNFMDIGLMTYVENNLIFRRIENLMQGQSQLYHAQVRRQMAAGVRNNTD